MISPQPSAKVSRFTRITGSRGASTSSEETQRVHERGGRLVPADLVGPIPTLDCHLQTGSGCGVPGCHHVRGHQTAHLAAEG